MAAHSCAAAITSPLVPSLSFYSHHSHNPNSPTTMPLTPRTTHEQRTVELMIRLYCRHKEGNKELCPQCRELLEYATSRLARCPFQDNKPTCRLCKVHCYKPEKREQIRQIMRYAGPRMLLYYPADAIKHMIREMMLKIKRKHK